MRPLRQGRRQRQRRHWILPLLLNEFVIVLRVLTAAVAYSDCHGAAEAALCSNEDDDDDDVIWHWSNQSKRPNDDEAFQDCTTMNDLENRYAYYHALYSEIYESNVAHDRDANFEIETELRIIRQEEEDESMTVDDESVTVQETERIRNDHVSVVANEDGEKDCNEKADDSRRRHKEDDDTYSRLVLHDVESTSGSAADDATIEGGVEDDNLFSVNDMINVIPPTTSEDVETESVDSKDAYQHIGIRTTVGIASVVDDSVAPIEVKDTDSNAISSEQTVDDDKDGSLSDDQKDAVSTPPENPTTCTIESEETAGLDSRSYETGEDDNIVPDSINGEVVSDPPAHCEMDQDASRFDVPSNETVDKSREETAGSHKESSSSDETTVDRPSAVENRTHSGVGDEDVIDLDILDSQSRFALREKSGDVASSKDKSGDKASSKDEPGDKVTIGDEFTRSEEQEIRHGAADEVHLKERKLAYTDEDIIDFDTMSDATPSDERGTDETTMTQNDSSGLSVDDGIALSSTANYSKDASDDSTNDTAPKKGSTSEFIETVSEKQPAMQLDGHLRQAKTMADDDTSNDDPLTNEMEAQELLNPEETLTIESALSDDGPQPSVAWGVRRQPTSKRTIVPVHLTKPLASTAVMEKDASSDILRERPAEESNNFLDNVGSGEEMDASEDKPVAGETDDFRQGKKSDSTEPPKSVNSEFVDGLDDLDKFFQSVDPPDELDVGAVGSSIQEVLIGQSAQILIKRVKLGFEFIKRRFSKVKVRMNEFVSRRTTRDGEFALITRGDVQAAVDKLKRLGKRALTGIKDIAEDLFATNDDTENVTFDLDYGLEEVRAKIDSLREVNRAPARPF